MTTTDPTGDLIDQLLEAGDRSRPYYDAKPLGPCRWCRPHQFHGLSCTECGCESSWTSRDDSWRPSLGHYSQARASAVMHDTGADGWTAHLSLGVTGTSRRIRHYLYGSHPQ